MTGDVAVHTEGLTKFYGPQRGVENLDLETKAGEVMGLLGPNGAGKTTTAANRAFGGMQGSYLYWRSVG
jgi:ABC-2 type transport system ATP-binding protein